MLYSFNDNTADGCQPEASLVIDADGNLYGTTAFGGRATCSSFPATCGTVFELMPQPGGAWTEKILHFFDGTGKDGVRPTYAGLVFDVAGNLYGTTTEGGSKDFGTVFELTPKADGNWTEKVLHSFHADKDGGYPQASLTIDAAGNLYGTTFGGGVYGYGTVFEVSPNGKGWKEKVLHDFDNNGTDGYQPQGNSLVLDHVGNLYATTTWGGIAFELTPPAKGTRWTEKILVTFNNADGSIPMSGLIFDGIGNLYGTAAGNGTYNGGTVFEVTP